MADDIVGKLIFQVDTDTKKAEKGINDFNDSMKESQEVAKDTEKSFDDSANKISAKGVAIALAVGTAVAKMAKEVAKATNEIQEGRQTIVNATGATGDALEGLMATAKNVYATTEESFDDVTRAIGEINTRLGLTDVALENTTRLFLDFADVTGQDVQQSVVSVTQAMNRWGIDAEGLPSLLDKLTVAGQASGISVATLTSNLTQNAGTFKAMGYSLDEAIAMMMTFEKQGIETNSVLMGMKKSFETSAKAGTDARTDWENLLKSISDATDEAEANSIAIEAFGNRIATDMVTALQDGSLNFDEFALAISNAEGALEATDTAGKTTGERIQTLKNQVKVAMSELGESFAPIIEDILPTIVELISMCTTAIKGFTDAIGLYKKSIDEAREAGITWISYGDDEFATNMAMYEATLKNAESKETLAKKTLTAGEREKAYADATSDSIRAEKLATHATKERTQAVEESTEATKEDSEATEENANAHEKTAEELKKEREEKLKAEALEKERIKTTETITTMLERQAQQIDENRAKELLATGEIEKAYDIKAKLLDKQRQKEVKALKDRIKENKATTDDLVKLETYYSNEAVRLEEEKNNAIVESNRIAVEQQKAEQEALRRKMEDNALTITDVYRAMGTNIGSAFRDLFDSVIDNSEDKIQQLQKAVGAFAGVAGNALYELGQSLVDGEADWTSLGKTALKALASIVRALAEEMTARAVLAYFSLNIAGGIALTAGATAAFIGAGLIDGYANSLLVGKDYVPYDDYPARLHRGEMVLDRINADKLRRYGGMYGVEQIASQPLGMDMQSLSPLNINNQLSAVIEVDGTQLGIAVLKNIDNASQFVLR